MRTFARTLWFAALSALAFGLPALPPAGTAASPAASPPERVVYLGHDLPDEGVVSLTAAVAASGRPAVVLLDSTKHSPYLKAFLAAYKPEQVVPVGAFPDGVGDLDERLVVKTAPPIPWTRDAPTALWDAVLPKVESVVVCPATPRRRLLQAACLAGATGAPLFVLHGDADEADELLARLKAWHAGQVYLIGEDKECAGARMKILGSQLDGELRVLEIRLEDEEAVADAYLRCLEKRGKVETVVVANPSDGGKASVGLSALAPWTALQKGAALLLTNDAGTDAGERVEAAVRNKALHGVENVILVGDLKTIPMKQRPNPEASDKEPTIDVEPLTPSGSEPFSFAVGRLVHEDPAVPLLLLARERLLAEAHGPRKALVASNAGGSLNLLEAFSRNTAREFRNAGYDTTALFGADVNGDDLRKRLPEYDVFLWEGHHNTLIKDYNFAAWDEPLPPSLVFLQSCLALRDYKVQPLLGRGAVGVIAAPARTYSGSGGACSLAFFDALLYDGQSLGGSLRQSKNFLLAYSQLKEKRLGKGATHNGASVRAADAFCLWGDPTLRLPKPEAPADALPAVHCTVSGDHITLTAPEETHPKVTTAKYQTAMPPNGRLAGMVHKDADDDNLSVTPFLFAEVRLPRGKPGQTPVLHGRLPSSHWVFCWDARRQSGYLLVEPRARDEKEFHFRVEWE